MNMQVANTSHRVAADSPSAASIPAAVCANCGEVGTGPYCSTCGQRQLTGRHTLRSVLGGIFGRFISIEQGFIHTAFLLTIRPGSVIVGYWAGRTIRYMHPGGYLLVCVAAFALTLRLFSGPTGAGEGNRLFALLIIPLVAGASRVLFWRSRYNYAEHLIAVMYLCGRMVLGLGVLSVGLPFLSGTAETGYGAAVLALGAGYFLWGYSRAFSARPVFAALAGLAALVLGAVAWVILMTLLVNWLRR